MAERTTQTVLQVAAQATSNELIPQTVLQVATQTTSNELISQAIVQVAIQAASNERITQTVLQTAAIPAYQNSVVNASHGNANISASNITFPKPSGTSNKNLMLAAISFAGDPGQSHITPASGFQLASYLPAIVTPGAVAVYYKYATGGEPSTYTFSWSGGAQIASGGMITLTGPTATNPIGNVGTNVGTINTNSPATVIINPQVNYSTIIEILAWTGTQTLTAPTGPWSQWWSDTNSAGMSTALSAHNWDTGPTLQQIGTLSGSPASYFTVSLEISGLVVGPPNKKKFPPPINGSTEFGTKIHSFSNSQVTSEFKPAKTLYSKMKRIGFGIGAQTSTKLLIAHISLSVTNSIKKTLLKSLITSINLTTLMVKNTGKNLTASVVILTGTLLKQIKKTLQYITNLAAAFFRTRFVNLNANLITLSSALTSGPSQLLLAIVSVSPNTILIKSAQKTLNRAVNLSSTLQNTIFKNLTTIVTLSVITVKNLSKSLIANILTLTSHLVSGPAVLLSAVVNVSLSLSLDKALSKFLNATINTSSTLNKFLNVSLNTAVSLIGIVNKNISKLFNTIVANVAIVLNSLNMQLISNSLILTASVATVHAAVTVILSTITTISTSVIKQIDMTLVSPFIVLINLLPSGKSIILSTAILVNSLISKTVDKSFAIIISLVAALFKRKPRAITLYIPLNPAAKSGIMRTKEHNMQAGEIGVSVNIFPYALPIPSNPVNLTGATCVLAVQNPQGNLTTLSLTVSSDGSYAYRLTLATDFPVGGEYEIQLLATFPDTTELKSPIQSLPIGLALE